MTAAPPRFRQPLLPQPRGPVSEALIDALRHGSAPRAPAAEPDPYGADLQLALQVGYELHYQGFADAVGDREWDPAVLALRVRLEEQLLAAIRDELAAAPADTDARAAMDRLSVEPLHGDGTSWQLAETASFAHFRDYFAMRSLYHLKEADPHAWAIPRLRRTAKAAFVAVEYDEFGAGRGAHVHQELFADLLAAADLRTDYLGYLDTAPDWAMLPVNLMSALGLRRSLRAATIGHFAATEITSPPGSARLLAGLERLDAPEACRHFYREHVEADAVHEQVLRHEVVGGLLAGEPELNADVVFGIRAFELVEDRFEQGLMAAWEQGLPLAG